MSYYLNVEDHYYRNVPTLQNQNTLLIIESIAVLSSVFIIKHYIL